jgi:hypothetical protein
MARGDHIYVDRGLYTHHGIDVGGADAIDFAAQDGGKAAARIRRVTLTEFAQGAPIMIREHAAGLGAEETVARAVSMLGKSGYDLFSNNCEHFASWCATGKHSSAQVDAARGTVALGITLLAPHLAGRARRAR